MKALRAALLLLLLPVMLAGPARSHAAATAPGAAGVIRFPADAALHPSTLIEWWYTVGHLTDAAGHRYGFEVTFFKFRGLRRYFPGSSVDLVYRTDVAITDETAHRFHHDIVYTAADPPRTIGDPRELRLRAGGVDIATRGVSMRGVLSYHVHGAMPDGAVDLSVASRRAPMLIGGGIVPFGIGTSYYYSLTDLQAAGTLTLGRRHVAVRGIAWMDHQWGSWDQTTVLGWDWMGIQLGDHTAINLMNQRVLGAGPVQWTMTQLPDGRQRYETQVSMTPLGHWRSPTTGATFPSGWRVRVPDLRLDLVVRPTVADQEMWDSFVVLGYHSSYWEGSCTVSGSHDGRPVSGLAYVELTGYGAIPPTIRI